ALDELGGGPGNFIQAMVRQIREHRSDQTLGRFHSEADVDLRELQQTVIGPNAVDLRQFAKRASDGGDDEVVDSELDEAGIGVELAAQLEQLRYIGFGKDIEMRDVALRLGETSSGNLLVFAKRLHLTSIHGNRLDRCGLGLQRRGYIVGHD